MICVRGVQSLGRNDIKMVIIGIFLLVLSASLATYAGLKDRKGFWKVSIACLFIFSLGVLAIFYNRIEEIGIGNVASIKLAKKQAEEEVEAIRKIKVDIERQNAKIAGVTKQANQALDDIKDTSETIKSFRTDIETQAGQIDSISKKAELASQSIEKMKAISDAVEKYGSLANINFNGMIITGSMGSSSKYQGWKNNYVSLNKKLEGGRYRIEGENMCSTEAVNHYKSYVEKYPYWPFAQFMIAFCLRKQGDNEWKEHAGIANQIFLGTTNTPGKHQDHILINHLLDKFYKPNKAEN